MSEFKSYLNSLLEDVVLSENQSASLCDRYTDGIQECPEEAAEAIAEQIELRLDEGMEVNDAIDDIIDNYALEENKEVYMKMYASKNEMEED